MGKVIQLTIRQKEGGGTTKTNKKQKGKSLKLAKKPMEELKEFENDLNLCLTQIKRIKNTLVELEDLEYFLESLLYKDYHDKRITSAIKDMNALLREVTTLWCQRLSEIKRKLR